MPFDLELPGAVEGGDAALDAGEFVDGAGAQVGMPQASRWIPASRWNSVVTLWPLFWFRPESPP